MTTLIGIMPNVQTAQITIPNTVKAITGYNAAVVYDKTTGKIVDPTFNKITGLIIGENQTLLDLGSVGAFQKLGDGAIVDGNNNGGTVTAPSLKPDATITGLDFLTSIQYENGSQLQSIGPKAFEGCSNLKAVNLPSTTNTIGAQAFQNCINLQTINLKGVQYIGDSAFNNAFIAGSDAIATANPVSLDLSSAQYIGQGAFDSSTWTTTVARAANDAASGAGTEKGQLSKISSVTFGSKLNTLKPYAFNGDNYLTAVDLSSCTSLATISNNAFRKTDNLKSVKFSNAIGTIEEIAFNGATSLATANFPSGLQTIGASAFSGAKLTGSFSPESTTLNIGNNAFDGSQFDTIDFSKVTGNLTIGQSAFANNSTLNTITFADNTKLKADSQLKIMSQAFAGCTKLTLGTAGAQGQPSSLTLPSNLTLLANNAFPSSIKYQSTYTNNLQFGEDTLISNNALGGKWDVNQNGNTNSAVNTNTTTLGPQLFANDTNVNTIDLSGSNIQALG